MLKKSDLYSTLWKSCDELRGGMDASQYKDYILTLLFVKYVSDKSKANPNSLIEVPAGGSFDDMLAAKGDKEIGDKLNKIIANLANANNLQKVIDLADFNDEEKLGKAKEMQDRLSKLVTIFADLDFRGSRAEGDDLLGDAYEYLMRHFATESGKSKGQFYTPAEVSRILAKVLGIGDDTRQDQTVYDPACGSGSLLLKVADESPRGITIYGQEKDNATWALSKMNMILHGNEVADIQKGDTITNPQFTSHGELRTFDYAVANPPFSIKSWSNGLENEYGRFELGRPPEKNGDYAFLLHILKSLKSTGRAAVILPHGVLFRGYAEATIRKRLVEHGYIKGIIGLPANLFYGTGIPACIIVLDKNNAQSRKGIFMIDASSGFAKDGPKNRLRSQDIHKIVDVFTKQTEIERFSRMVPVSEIADPKNDFSLNIPRYIDSSEPTDIHDLNAHINGGIPNADIETLQKYWDAFPTLREQLFESERTGYSKLTIPDTELQSAILESKEFTELSDEVNEITLEWFNKYISEFEQLDKSTKLSILVSKIGEDLLAKFKSIPLLDEYDIYEQLMTYWHSTMHDDAFMIMSDGWLEASRPRKAIDDKERKLTETPDLVLGNGKNAVKYKTDLVPSSLLVNRYFSDNKNELDALTITAADAQQELDDFLEENTVDEGILVAALDGEKITKASAKSRLSISSDKEEIAALNHVIELFDKTSKTKKEAKQAESLLTESILNKYGELTDKDVKEIVIVDKWQTTLAARITQEVTSLTLDLVNRIEILNERYGETLANIDTRLGELDDNLNASLNRMGMKIDELVIPDGDWT
ncbi:MAG: type restriction-modification system subunit, partial [Candidatus Saccharibacteria bacterium]|nr:type restriction-modification system subunit [Candidatus Saccharibacteria bacterium]